MVNTLKLTHLCIILILAQKKGFIKHYCIGINVIIWTLADRNNKHFTFMYLRHQGMLLNKVCWHF